MEKSKRKVWTEAETLLFLKCYNKRKDEFQHSRKKKFAYENVLKDMILQGFTDTTVNVAALVAKMRTLFNAYKTAKANEKQTGKMPYISEMDKIFGKSCLVSNNHTINIPPDPQEALDDSSEDTTVNAAAVVAKMRTLLNSYKTVKTNEKQTGKMPYISEMDKIFGKSCLVSNNHTINIPEDPQEAMDDLSEDTTVNAAALVAKMRTLLNAYKTAKDNEKNGTIPYKSGMDEIFGESFLVSNNHTINIGTDPQEPLIESSVNEFLKESTDFEAMLDDMQSSSRQSRSALNRSMCTTTEVYPQEPNTANATPYRKSARERYFEQKIELKRKSAEEKSKFFANIQSKIQDLVVKRDLQMEIEQKKLKIEEEKLKLLQQYVMNKR